MNRPTILEMARSYVRVGLSIIPIKTDGSKAPVNNWKERQERLPTDQELIEDFGNGKQVGIAIITGSVSDSFEVADFDDPSLLGPWADKCVEAGLSNDLLLKMLVIKTPGGWHIGYRCPDEIEGNKKLAQRQHTDGKLETLIETRGQGGYVIAPGSPLSCHPENKAYELKRGSFDNIPIVSVEERQIIHDVAATFNEYFKEVFTPGDSKAAQIDNNDGLRPGDDFNQRADWWQDILSPAGCRKLNTKGNESYLVKPGSASKAPHATLNWKGIDKLYVFSSSFPSLEPMRAYDKYQAYTFLFHGGNFVEAARTLSKKDYGTKKLPQDEDAVTQTQSTKWAEPVLFDKIDTPDIPYTFLPKWLADYIEALIHSAQVPPALPVMQGLAVLATALQKKFEVCPYGDSYTEPLSLWTIVVSPPSTRKSRIVTELTIPLNRYEKDEEKRLKPEIAKHTAEQKAITKRIEDLEKKAGKMEDEAERKKLIDEMAKLQEKLEEPLLAPRLWTGDITPERLQSLMAEHGGKMSVLSDEGGIFEVMAGLYNDGKANIDVFLKAHAGSAVRVDRGKRTVIINSPALSFGIMVQFQIINEFSQGSKRRFRGLGTCARFLWAIPKSNIGKRDVTKRVSISDQVVADYINGVLNLLQVSPAVNENGVNKPWKLTLSDEAKECWLQFCQYIEVRQGDGADLEPIQDWSGKLPGAALRIAGLLHVSKHGHTGTTQPSEYLTIAKETMENALDLCDLLIEHAKVAFGIIGADPAVEDAKFAFQWIAKEQRESFKQSDLLRTGRFNKSKVDRLQKALEILRERHIISDPRREATRKPTIIYDVNPAIYLEPNK